jgi:hypothetical protein
MPDRSPQKPSEKKKATRSLKEKRNEKKAKQADRKRSN